MKVLRTEKMASSDSRAQLFGSIASRQASVTAPGWLAMAIDDASIVSKGHGRTNRRVALGRFVSVKVGWGWCEIKSCKR